MTELIGPLFVTLFVGGHLLVASMAFRENDWASRLILGALITAPIMFLTTFLWIFVATGIVIIMRDDSWILGSLLVVFQIGVDLAFVRALISRR